MDHVPFTSLAVSYLTTLNRHGRPAGEQRWCRIPPATGAQFCPRWPAPGNVEMHDFDKL